MKTKMRCACVTLGTTLCLVGSAQADLIVNGDFETGTLGTAWVQACASPPVGFVAEYTPPFSTSVESVSPYTGVDTYNAVTGPSENGSAHLYLFGSWRAPTELYQDITTTPGVTYTLTFSASLLLPQIVNYGTPAAPDLRGSLADVFNAKVDGATVFSFQGSDLFGVPIVPLPYAVRSADFTATAATTRVQFQGQTLVDWVHLDNVSVVPSAVPEPATLGLLGLGLLALVARKRT